MGGLDAIFLLGTTKKAAVREMAGNSPVRYPHRNVSPLRGFGDGFGALSGRPSALHNEDDFDYAIELSPDDEYR